jgi:hypothetical protein
LNAQPPSRQRWKLTIFMLSSLLEMEPILEPWMPSEAMGYKMPYKERSTLCSFVVQRWGIHGNAVKMWKNMENE